METITDKSDPIEFISPVELLRMEKLPPLPDKLQRKVANLTFCPPEILHDLNILIKDFQELPDNKSETLYDFVGLGKDLTPINRKPTSLEVIFYFCEIKEIAFDVLREKTKKETDGVNAVGKRMAIAHFIINHNLHRTLTVLGMQLGYKAHTAHSNVLYAKKMVEGWYRVDSYYREQYDEFANKILNKFNLIKQ